MYPLGAWSVNQATYRAWIGQLRSDLLMTQEDISAACTPQDALKRRHLSALDHARFKSNQEKNELLTLSHSWKLNRKSGKGVTLWEKEQHTQKKKRQMFQPRLAKVFFFFILFPFPFPTSPWTLKKIIFSLKSEEKRRNLSTFVHRHRNGVCVNTVYTVVHTKLPPSPVIHVLWKELGDRQAIMASIKCWTLCSHMLRDVTYTFWSENRVQDCAVRPVAVAAGRRKVIWPVNMATGRRLKRSKVKGHVGTAIQHSYLGRNQAAPWPRPLRLRASVRICLARPASSCWIDYILCTQAPLC